MQKEWLRILVLTAATLAITFSASGAAVAQQQAAPKEKDAEKPATTSDAWKQALPESEAAGSPVDATLVSVEAEETPAQVVGRLTALERRWAEAVKLQDGATLKRILADDFTLAGEHPAGAVLDKTRYIDGALKDGKLSSYSFDKLNVRVYGDTAVVHTIYKQQAAGPGKESSGEFLVTDVWVKSGKRWRVVTRHLSRATKAP